MQQDPDVLISGAGPAGLFAAHCLTRAGAAVDIVDTGIWPCSHSYALALHPETVELLNRSGIATADTDRISELVRLAFYDRQGERAAVSLLSPSGKGLTVLPQSALEAQLERSLAASRVQVDWRHKVMRVQPAEDSVRATLNRYEKESGGYVVSGSSWVVGRTWDVDSRFVIGADGYASSVRRSLNIPFPEVGPCAWFAVFEFHSDYDLPAEVRVTLGEKTTDVLWPLGDGWFRWSFEMPGYIDGEGERLAAYRGEFGEPADRTKDRLEHTMGDVNTLPDTLLRQFISERAAWFSGSIGEVGWRTAVRFERRLADSFGRQNCWLVGDAAHLTGPVGVQSLNLGLFEAHDAAECIGAALRGGSAKELFHSYANRYTAEWRRLLGINREIESNPGVDPWIWDARNRILPCLPAHGARLMEMAAALRLRL